MVFRNNSSKGIFGEIMSNSKKLKLSGDYYSIVVNREEERRLGSWFVSDANFLSSLAIRQYLYINSIPALSLSHDCYPFLHHRPNYGNKCNGQNDFRSPESNQSPFCAYCSYLTGKRALVPQISSNSLAKHHSQGIGVERFRKSTRWNGAGLWRKWLSIDRTRNNSDTEECNWEYQ